MGKVLAINDLNYKKNNKLILKNINLQLDNGKIVGLLGSNGAGKTTLMRLISGVKAKNSGQIVVAGIDGKAARKSCVSMTYPLDGFRKGIGEKNTKVKDVVKFYIDIYPDFSFEKYQAMAKYLEISCDEKLANLSTGTSEKLVIALALARQVPLYLLDEPLNGVDIMARKKIIKSIIQWKGDDSTIIISSHYVKEISSLLDDVVILKDQTIYQMCSVEDIQTKYHLGIEEYYEKVYEGGLENE
ncbi:ABC transporter ATP-binding protein [Companilactobacillus zhachilii]|uniref:ATP-binding cassette domain-containing protein n=1 Tax=Companilactobacillus zhachilii TaxID=2304606 RepID=UPI001921E2AA|nr:ABC transporter ATP-binding protein [Companilactobacillus zhachilii]MBL3531898.1 ABC transporter ATP-binding protein [Companilactobacillus zhachilii]